MIKKLIISLAVLIVLLSASREKSTSKDYLKNVLEKLNKIESASYISEREQWFPGDTAASRIFHQFIQEYKNPSDTTIGAKYVMLDSLTKTNAEFCYDGQMRAVFYRDEKEIIIDSFTVRPLPFRPLNPPFYNYTASIINYALHTKDSISLEIQELKNDIFVRLTINEAEQVEFFGKAFHMPPSPYDFGENTSIYEIWIDKKSDLPYKRRREMSHDISVEICQNAEFNQLNINNFKASDYFPADYKLIPYGTNKNNHKNKAFLNKKAPDWTLQSADKRPVSLSDFKSKVLMIQFTSVTCGPCKASIPFLKELQKEYKESDFEFVAIESSSNNTNVLKTYMDRNRFNYQFLLSDKQVIKDYSISSYPVFYILDQNRIIKEVIKGYGAGNTDNQIRTVINQLLK